MTYQDLIIAHYENVWHSKANMYLWDKGPIEKLLSDFRVLEFSPNANRDMWTYATCCMSSAESNNPPIELHLFSSKKDESIIELLTTVAYYHKTTYALDLNHTVNFGRPWQDKSTCEFGFISLPYLDGPDLEDLVMNETNKTVKFYWLIPVTKKELDFKIAKGSEALEARLEQKQFNYLNPLRRSVV